MKFCWRITKYDPKYRNTQGAFLKDDWIAYSDIGQSFNSIKLNYKEYSRIEDLYINAIQSFMNCHNITSLQIITLEKSQKLKKDIHNTDNMIALFNTVKEKDWLSQEDIKDFCKLILRNKLWSKLIYSRKMFVHFGWDFYMYIGSSLQCTNTISTIENSGLFAETFESPYQ